jgi:hypothetical protein
VRRGKTSQLAPLLGSLLIGCGGRLDGAVSSKDPAVTADDAGSDAAADARADSFSVEASPPEDPYVLTFDSAECGRRGDRCRREFADTATPVRWVRAVALDCRDMFDPDRACWVREADFDLAGGCVVRIKMSEPISSKMAECLRWYFGRERCGLADKVRLEDVPLCAGAPIVFPNAGVDGASSLPKRPLR